MGPPGKSLPRPGVYPEFCYNMPRARPFRTGGGAPGRKARPDVAGHSWRNPGRDSQRMGFGWGGRLVELTRRQGPDGPCLNEDGGRKSGSLRSEVGSLYD